MLSATFAFPTNATSKAREIKKSRYASLICNNVAKLMLWYLLLTTND